MSENKRSNLQRIASMKLLQLVGLMACFTFFSCGDDDSVRCVTCSNELTTDFTLCRESNGDASVNGQDTDTDYEVYLSGLTEQGTDCN